MRIPITIVSGFLGSGKTTLINNVLKNDDIKKEEIIIIENEIGDVSIDHELLIESVEEVYQMNQGCICCNLRSDLLAVLQKISKLTVEEDWPLKHIIIETTGIADPRPIVQSINVMGGVYEGYYVDAVYSVVDTLNYAHIREEFPEVEKQIVFADRIYLSKSENNDADALIVSIKQINPFATFTYFTADETIPSETFFNQNLFNQADSIEPLTEAELHALDEEEHAAHHHHHDHDEHDHEHTHEYHHEHEHNHHGIETIYLTTDIPLSRKYFQMFLNWLLINHMNSLYRYKGFFSLNDTENAFILQGVGEHYAIDPFIMADKGKTQLVLIGKDLNEKDIKQSFKDLIAYTEQETNE